MTTNDRLDVTLAAAKFVPPSLAMWLLEAAEHPEDTKAVIVDKQDGQFVIELQDRQGVATYGVLLLSWPASIHVDGAADPDNEPFTKRRSLAKMNAALAQATHRRSYEERLRAVSEVFFFGIIPIVALIGLYFAVTCWLS